MNSLPLKPLTNQKADISIIQSEFAWCSQKIEEVVWTNPSSISLLLLFNLAEGQALDQIYIDQPSGIFID